MALAESSVRRATLERTTGETTIAISVDLDGAGRYNVDTGNGFLDHMVSQISRHGLFDIDLKAVGDTHVGWHHLVEDTAIMLGRAFGQALGNEPRGIRRYGARPFVPHRGAHQPARQSAGRNQPASQGGSVVQGVRGRTRPSASGQVPSTKGTLND